MVIVALWFHPTDSWSAFVVLVSTLLLTPALILGIVIACFASRHGSRLQGDIAMAIFVGSPPSYVLNCHERLLKRRHRIQPSSWTQNISMPVSATMKLCQITCYDTGAKVTIRRKGDYLVWQVFWDNAAGPLDLYPESETIFFFKKMTRK